MANARPGYKRIMGEIPEEMHKKITLYNKISERPLNVSRAIELCIENAVKKIDSELIEQARECGIPDSGAEGVYNDEHYQSIVDDVNAGYGPEEIQKRYIERFSPQDRKVGNVTIICPQDEKTRYTRMSLYPIDDVVLNEKSKAVFYARGIPCFSVGSLKEHNKRFEAKY